MNRAPDSANGEAAVWHACTTPNVFAKVLRGTPRPVDGQPFQLLTRLARELGCAIGGGFIAMRGEHTYGTFVLAEPDGAVHMHDKDIPTAWEQHFYVGGDDEGVTRSETLGCQVGSSNAAKGLKNPWLPGGSCWRGSFGG